MPVYFCGLDHIPPRSWLLSVNTRHRQPHPANTEAISHQFTYLTYTLYGSGHVGLIWRRRAEKMMVFDILKEVVLKYGHL